MDTGPAAARPAAAEAGPTDRGPDHDHGDHDHDHGDHDQADHGPVTAVAVASPGAREAAVRRARRLNVVTIGWNAVEGVVAVLAGVAAGSVSLIGFGLDSAIEVSAAVILALHLRREGAGACMQESDRRATRAIAVSFGLLAGYVAFESVRDLLTAGRPDVSVPGLVIAVLSLLVMPWLARAKRRLAPALGSRAVEADATQTNLCAMLSGVLLAGLGLNAVAGWWWSDPLAGIAIAVVAAREAVVTWRAESLEDTCCA